MMMREDSGKVCQSRKVIRIHENDMGIGLGTGMLGRTLYIERGSRFRYGV